MPLMTCSKVFRPWLSLFRPAADPTMLNGCRRFSSFQKPSNFVSGRLSSRHQSKGNPHRESGWPISDNGLVVLGFSLLGSILLFVSMLKIFFVYFFCIRMYLLMSTFKLETHKSLFFFKKFKLSLLKTVLI